MTTISLREWEIARTDAGSPLSPTDHRLAERLTHTGRMEVLELASCLELRTTSFVGRVAFSELTVTISPKISGAPLLSLFRYAYGLRQLDLYGAADFASSSWSFQDLIIRQLAAEASELLQRGIHREYERVRADLASPRGRIDFACYIHVTRGTETTLPCVYHPRSENTLLNRVLLAGLNLAADLAIDTELKGHVRRLSREFGAMVAAQLLDTQAMSDAWHAMDRRTSVYQPAFRLIDLLLGAQGLALDEQGSSVRLEGFLFDMNRFFQALLSRFLREHLNSVDVHDEFRLRDIFSYEQRRNPLGRRNPSLRPDFVLLRNATIVAVLDAKYRDLWAQPLPREMLYQLALYALGRSGAIREAVILYPTLDGGAREQAIIVQEPLRGRPQARIALRPVNLLELETQLREWRSARLRREALAQRLAFG